MDRRDQVIDCTLWDFLAVQFLTIYDQQSATGPVVFTLKHARVKEPQVLNQPKEATYLAQSSNISNSTQFYTQASAGSQYNSDDNFMKQARVISLADMKKLKTVCIMPEIGSTNLCYGSTMKDIDTLRLNIVTQSADKVELVSNVSLYLIDKMEPKDHKGEKIETK
ncbi:hypothetical protein P8452_26698 [Trifolium repens]|nr:hypothetical protein P8452_26698 [Trifolium repens]